MSLTGRLPWRSPAPRPAAGLGADGRNCPAERLHKQSTAVPVEQLSEKLPSSNRVEPSHRQDACDDEEHQHSALRDHKRWLGPAGCGHSGGEATFHLVPPVQDQGINKCPASRHRSCQMRLRPCATDQSARLTSAPCFLRSIDMPPSSTWTVPVAYQRLQNFRTSRLSGSQCASFIRVHQAAEADYICGQYCCEATLHNPSGSSLHQKVSGILICKPEGWPVTGRNEGHVRSGSKVRRRRRAD